MKALLYKALQDNAALAELVGDRIYPMGALGVGDVPAAPALPYIQYRMGEAFTHPEVRETSTSLDHTARIFVYGEKGSTVVIDQIHRLVRQTVEGLAGVVSPSGRRCTDVVMLTLGEEATDARLGSTVRMASYRITGPQ